MVIDVLGGSVFGADPGAEPDPLLDLMWDLQRSAMYRNMRAIGVNVLAWQHDVTLDQVMHLVAAGVHR